MDYSPSDSSVHGILQARIHPMNSWSVVVKRRQGYYGPVWCSFGYLTLKVLRASSPHLLLGQTPPRWQVVNNPPPVQGDMDSIPGWRRSPGGGNGQYSCLENSMESRAWRARVHGVAKSWTQLTTHTHTHTLHMCP